MQCHPCRDCILLAPSVCASGRAVGAFVKRWSKGGQAQVHVTRQHDRKPHGLDKSNFRTGCETDRWATCLPAPVLPPSAAPARRASPSQGQPLSTNQRSMSTLPPAAAWRVTDASHGHCCALMNSHRALWPLKAATRRCSAHNTVSGCSSSQAISLMLPL